MRFKRLGCLLTAFIMTAAFSGACSQPPALRTPKPPPPLGAVLTGGRQLVASNELLELYADPATGDIEVLDKRSGRIWYSSPPDAHDEEIATGLARNLALSQITINFIDKASNVSPALSKVESADAGGLKLTALPDGVRADYHFPRRSIHIPVTFTLDGDSLVTSVLAEEIREDDIEFNRLHSVSLLPYFGAGGRGDEGYMIVPDGSGSLIEYNSGTARVDYMQHIYGRDDVLSVRAVSTVSQTALLPVFGVQNNGGAFAAIIDSGEMRAILRAHVSGDRPYNTVYPEFIFRSMDSVLVRERTWDAKTIMLTEEVPVSSETFTVRYAFLPDDEADYTGMAARTRRHLVENKGMVPVPLNNIPLYIEVYGGVMRSEPVMGIPVNRVAPFTTYAQTADMAQELTSLGVNDLFIVYRLWDRGGSVLDINSGLRTERSLGGRSAFNSMIQTLRELGARISLDVNLVEINRARPGFGIRGSTVRTISRTPLQIFQFQQANFQPNDFIAPIYLLKPSRLTAEAQRAADRAARMDIDALSPCVMGTRLYSDYSRNGSDRGQTQQIIQESLDILAATAPLVMSAPAAYALPSASAVLDIPIESSSLMIESRAIPFYQIALHGLVPISTPSVNAYSDPHMVLLKALETGSALKFTLNAQNLDKLKHTGYEYLFSSDMERWLPAAAELYREAAPILNRVANAFIRSHQAVAPDAALTVFENGVHVLVNYSRVPVVWQGHTADPMGYAVWEGDAAW
jgi:hypothetical protein